MPPPTEEASMNRRTLLTTAAVAIGGLVAGCSGSGNGNASNGTNGSGGTATEAPTEPSGSATTAPTTRSTSNTETTSPEATNTREPGTTDESMKTSGPQTETSRMSTTEVSTPETTTATTAPTTTTTEGTETTDTAIAIPDPPSTQNGMGVAQVAFEKGGSRVVVSGTITAENGCQKATLASVQSNGSELVVTIGTERAAGTNMACTQVLTPVEYRFVLTPDTAPKSVTVVHATINQRRTVTTVERGK